LVVGYELGVDLGTTYTAAAVLRGGVAEVVTLGTRTLEIPSVVCLLPDGEMLVGEAGERRSVTDADRFVREFKRRIGDPTPILLGGTPYSAHALTARLLRAVVTTVVDREGGPPARLVVTCPATWSAYRRELLEQAIKQADVGPAELATEPEAAAVHYASTTRVASGEVVAVYDLGGGTFDATVLRHTGTGFELVGEPTGLDQLGGVHFDEAVFSYVVGELDPRALRLPAPDDPALLAALIRLRRECVEAKEALSSDTEVTIPVNLPALRTDVRLTRGELETMLAPALAETIEALRRALRSAQLEPEDITAVLLVGGSSRIPLVAQTVSHALGRPTAVDIHPKHAVALGAARLAAGAPTTATPAGARHAARRGVPVPVDAPGRGRRVAAGAAAVAVVVAGVGWRIMSSDGGGGNDGRGDGTESSTSGPESTRPVDLAGSAIELPKGPPLDTSTLVYTSVVGTEWNVWLIGSDGSGARQLTHEAAVFPRLPATSPDRRTIAYTVQNGASWELWATDSNGDASLLLSPDMAPDSRATWSPDGTKLAFVSDRDGPADIYVLDLSNGDLSNLTNSAEEEGDPAWSPDGTSIVYWSRVAGNQDVYVRSVDDSGDAPRRLTQDASDDADPAWHPNGRSISFASRRDGDWEIFLMSPTGQDQRQLTDNGVDDQDPVWSPDGGFIAFESKRDTPERDDYSELYVMLAEGGDQHRITTRDGFDAHPDWGREP
jgi:Tol biopolymer transport system component/actin-like ATPase involved in cell morphogenesis